MITITTTDKGIYFEIPGTQNELYPKNHVKALLYEDRVGFYTVDNHEISTFKYDSVTVNGTQLTEANAKDTLEEALFKVGSGSGSAPTLQEITDSGNETTNVIKIADGVDANDAVTKGQLDTKQELLNIAAYSVACRNTSTAGSPTDSIPFETSPHPVTLARRDADGKLSVNAGTEALHAVNVTQLNAVKASVEGKTTNRVFEDEAALDAWLIVQANLDTLKAGDTFLLINIDEPDYWWDGTQKQELETRKIDLTEYAKTADVNTALDGKATKLGIQQGGIPYRAIAGIGEPDSYILASVSPTTNFLAQRTTGGQTRVGTAVLTDAAVPLEQANTLISTAVTNATEATDLASLPGYNNIKDQILEHKSGILGWGVNEIEDLTLLPSYDNTETQQLVHVNGVFEWRTL